MPERVGGPEEHKALHAEIARLRAAVDAQQRTLDALSNRQEAITTRQRDLERYRALVQESSPLVWSVNVRGNWGKEVNSWWEEMTGQSIRAASGWGWLSIVHPDDREPTRKRLMEALKKPIPFQQECRIRLRNEEYRWFASYGVPLLNPDGSVREWIGMLTDITEQKRLSEQLLQAQKLEGIGRLAGGIAHDFNNLLTAILGFAELAEESLPEDSPERKDIANIHKAATRASDLTRQLLTFARKQAVEPKVISIGAIVTEDETILRRLLREDITFTVHLEPDLWKVKMDPGQITQILVNLAVNARDAMPHGGTLTITTANATLSQADAQLLTEGNPGQYVLLRVSDTGVGIPEEVRPYLYEPFYTTKERGKGTGLGLATIYGIVKQNGGYITVDSEPGVGTTFSIYLPSVAEVPAPVIPPRKSRPPSGRERTILLVEDEALVRDVAARILHSLNYKVIEAANGAEALETLQVHREQIDLVLTDTIMPQMGGALLIPQLRQAYPGLKIVLMSGYFESPVLSLAAEADAFLQKPFTPASLAQKLREALAENSDDTEKPLIGA